MRAPGSSSAAHRGHVGAGHNLDSERGFAQSVARGGENLNGATWRSLTEFLVRALPGERTLANCFFSNFLIGLIEGSSAVGLFPGTKDLAFVERCRSFLVHQVQVVRPSLLLVLGIHTPRLLAALSPGHGALAEREDVLRHRPREWRVDSTRYDSGRRAFNRRFDASVPSQNERAAPLLSRTCWRRSRTGNASESAPCIVRLCVRPVRRSSR